MVILDVKIRTLEEICKGDAFSINLYGNYYCKLNISSSEIKCDYRNINPDYNGLYTCDAAMVKYGVIDKN